MRLDASENAKQLLDQWVESLAQVLEAMTDQKPVCEWQAASGIFGHIPLSPGSEQESEILWWEQPFQPAPGAKTWVAAPRVTWENAGTLTLKAAGLETVELSEARNTWIEVLSQSLSAMARAIGAQVGREVSCDPGAERSPGSEIQEWATVSLTFAGQEPSRLCLALSPEVLELISKPPSSQPARSDAEVTEAYSRTAQPSPRSPSRTMELLLDVDLPVSISFGKAELPLKDVLKLTTGSIVELNRTVSEPVEVLVNHCLIARGEVVVVEGNYAVRIQEIADRRDRLRSIR